MKRIKFLSGVSAMCAFAVIALAGSLFTSCDKEDFKGTFQPDPAQAIINVSVIDLATGSSVSGASITASAGVVSGMTVTLTGNATDGTLPAQTVTVTVTPPANFTIAETSKQVPVAALNAGSIGNYNVTFYANASVVWSESVVWDNEIAYNLVELNHSHSGGASWAQNANDREVDITLPYTEIRKVEVISDNTTGDAVAEAANIIAGLGGEGETEVEKDYTFKVPAWSNYRAWYTVRPKTVTYTATKGSENLGSLVVYCILDDKLEAEIVDIPGHSHDHGTDNAGGGVGEAD